MGLLDGLRAILGSRAETDAGRDADPEDLFGMSTAYLTMEADLGYESLDVAALCFSGVDSTDFRDAVDE
ncbi:PspA-associated protein PspAB, partial [Natrinema altunense]